MKEQIFPKEFLTVSMDQHFHKYSKSGLRIYYIILILMILIGASIAIIKIDLVVQSQGMVRPVVEKMVLRSMVTGKVVYSQLQEDKKVMNGDVLLKIDSRELENRIQILDHSITQKQLVIQDLRTLFNNPMELESATIRLSSGLIQSDVIGYYQEIRKLKNSLNKANIEIKRHAELYKEKMISEKEMEGLRYDRDQLKSELTIHKQRKILEWKNLLDKASVALDQLQKERSLHSEKLTFYKVQAPATGTIQNIRVTMNAYVQAGEELAEISPDTLLLAEVYVQPNQVSLLKQGQEVQISVHAFHQNQWGTLKGKIKSISEDVTMVNKAPVFRVFCRLNDSALYLSNGQKGQLKKGMTISAFFLVNERTIFQIIYDRVEDWLIPELGKVPVNV